MLFLGPSDTSPAPSITPGLLSWLPGLRSSGVSVAVSIAALAVGPKTVIPVIDASTP